jgi:hypothetical protein
MRNRKALAFKKFKKLLYRMRPLQTARRQLGEHNTSKVNPILLLLGHAVVDKSDSRRVLFCYDPHLAGLCDDLKQPSRVQVSQQRFSELLSTGQGVLGDRDNAAAMMLAFKMRRFSRRLPAPDWSLTLSYAIVRQMFITQANFDVDKLSTLLLEWLSGRLVATYGDDDEPVIAPSQLYASSVARAIFGVTEQNAFEEESVDEQYKSIGWTPPSEWAIVKKMLEKHNEWQACLARPRRRRQ